MKTLSLILIFSINFLYANDVTQNEVKEIACKEELILILDEQNMTEEEIVSAKEDYFNQLLMQQNQDCISQSMGSSKITSSNSNKGGKVSGNEISNVKENSNIGETLATPSIISSGSSSNNLPKLNNGNIKCLEKYKNDDEFAVQLKEAISKTTDEELKKELILEYAKYNNIKPENLEC